MTDEIKYRRKVQCPECLLKWKRHYKKRTKMQVCPKCRHEFETQEQNESGVYDKWPTVDMLLQIDFN